MKKGGKRTPQEEELRRLRRVARLAETMLARCPADDDSPPNYAQSVEEFCKAIEAWRSFRISTFKRAWLARRANRAKVVDHDDAG